MKRLCPRCGSSLHRRKPNSIDRTWALLITAALLYIPANVYPVMTFTALGQGEPSTIIGGVKELIAANMWPLAADRLLRQHPRADAQADLPGVSADLRPGAIALAARRTGR